MVTNWPNMKGPLNSGSVTTNPVIACIFPRPQKKNHGADLYMRKALGRICLSRCQAELLHLFRKVTRRGQARSVGAGLCDTYFGLDSGAFQSERGYYDIYDMSFDGETLAHNSANAVKWIRFALSATPPHPALQF